MSGQVVDCLRSLVGAINKRVTMTVSEWASRYRVMAGGVSRWDNSRTPYLVEIMDALSEDSPYRVVGLQKGVQIGGSEAGYNFLGYIISQCPANVIIALPTEKLYKTVSKQRVMPMIEYCLKSYMKEMGMRRGTIDSRSFKGGELLLVTAKSAPSLRMMSARYIIADEVDAYPVVIEGEGDPVELLENRTAIYGWQSKIFFTGTPLLTDSSRIAAKMKLTDNRRYYVPCPSCSEMHLIEWKQIRWDRGDPSSARMECPKCKRHYAEDCKEDILSAGEWRGTTRARDGYIGFHLPALYSPYGWMPWSKCVEKFEESSEDEHKRQVFTNTILAETFEHYRHRPTLNKKNARQMDYGADAPREVLVVTCGVDVQWRRAEAYIYGWGRGEVPYALDYLRLEGDLTSPKFWKGLWRRLRDVRIKTADGRELRIAAIGIDSGGKHTTEVYRFVMNVNLAGYNNMLAIKGRAGYEIPIIRLSSTPVRRKVLPRPVPLWIVGVDTCKSTIYHKISEGIWHTPVRWKSAQNEDDYVSDEYYRQLTAEALEKKYVHGFARHRWVKERERNEALDCGVYAYAVLKFLNVDWATLEEKVAKKAQGVIKSRKRRIKVITHTEVD